MTIKETTHILYHNTPEALSCTAEVLATGQDERGVFAVLDQTVFYPQGGGQPADHGEFITPGGTLSVQDVRRVEGEIRHYYDSAAEQLQVGDHVTCQVDGVRRKLNTLYHSAGHLIGSLVEQLQPHWQAVKGHAFPGQAYVECLRTAVAEGLTPETPALDAATAETLHAALMDVVERALPVRAFECALSELPQGTVPADCPTGGGSTVRVVQMGDFPLIACGGTHVTSTGDLDQVHVTKCKTRDGRLRVSYEVICASPV